MGSEMCIRDRILARGSNLDDLETLSSLGYSRIDLVCVNLYPFESVANESPPVDEDVLLEMIDIGGPTLLRAAAKSHQDVLVVPRKKYYQEVIDALEKTHGDPSNVSMELRQRMAISAFQRTAGYDVMVASTLAERLSVTTESPEGIPARLLVSGGKALSLIHI